MARDRQVIVICFQQRVSRPAHVTRTRRQGQVDVRGGLTAARVCAVQRNSWVVHVRCTFSVHVCIVHVFLLYGSDLFVQR